MAKLNNKQRIAMKGAVVMAALATAAWLSLADPWILPGGLPPEMSPAAPQRCLGLFLVSISLWFTNLIPPAATGLFAVAMLPVLRILPENQALALFGNRAVFFMLGVFLLAGAMITTGLSKRITLVALHRFDRSPERLVNGVVLSAAFFSLWIPAHGVAAMLYPIIVEIVDALGLKRGANYAQKLFLALAWGAIIGSCGTLLGGARAPLALGILYESYPDKRLSFLQWMVASLPVVLFMIPMAMITLRSRMPRDLQDIKAATKMLDGRVRRLGPLSQRERRLGLLGIATILSWILLSDFVGLAVISMMSAVGLFLLRIVDWKAVQSYVNWGVLIMYGGAVALGKAVTETRAMEWIVGRLITPDAPPLLVLTLMVVATIVLTETVSNAAAVAILLPIGYSLGEMVGIGPIMMTLTVTLPAGFAFLLPVSSPPNAISFSAGHYSIREVVQRGWPLTVAAFVSLMLTIVVWWQWVLHVDAW